MKDRYEDNDVPCMDFDVNVSFALEKKCNVNTDDYSWERDDFENETWITTNDTDWEKAYNESHYTITEMLDELRKYVENEMRLVEPCSGRSHELKRLYSDCQGWKVIDKDFEQA